MQMVMLLFFILPVADGEGIGMLVCKLLRNKITNAKTNPDLTKLLKTHV